MHIALVPILVDNEVYTGVTHTGSQMLLQYSPNTQ